jgi:hypothetical protein
MLSSAQPVAKPAGIRADDPRCVCHARRFPPARIAESVSESQLDRFYSVVKPRSRRYHGSTGLPECERGHLLGDIPAAGHRGRRADPPRASKATYGAGIGARRARLRARQLATENVGRQRKEDKNDVA